jgi:hypothetical protein
MSGDQRFDIGERFFSRLGINVEQRLNDLILLAPVSIPSLGVVGIGGDNLARRFCQRRVIAIALRPDHARKQQNPSQPHCTPHVPNSAKTNSPKSRPIIRDRGRRNHNVWFKM